MPGMDVFNAFGTRQRTIGDYQQEADTQRANALLNQLNALKVQDAVQSQQDDQTYRGLARTFGTDSTANYNALMGQGLYRQAQALQAADLKARETVADIGLKTSQTKENDAKTQKTFLDAHKSRIGLQMDVLNAANSPEAYVQYLNQSINRGLMSPEEAQTGLAGMPADPAAFMQWREKQLLNGADIIKRKELEGKQANDMIIPDGKGGWTINQPLVGAKKDIARAGSSSTNVSYGAPVAGVDDKGNPVFFQPSKGGGAPAIVPGVRPKEKDPKALTEGQAKANLFGTRMDEADRVIADLEKAGVTSPSILQQVTGGSGVAGTAATAVATPQQQQVDQAQRDFINAVLRRESGAAISPTEFENARKQYFVQPGDAPEVIAQKARNRRTATQGMLAEVPENMRGIPGVGAKRQSGDTPADIADLLKKYGGK